jgi:sporulation integral membrane protein YlbJ
LKYYSNLILLLIIIILSVFMVINPKETVTAAADGVRLWAVTVFPALFPFFVIAELLISLRFVNFLGIMLEPVMRPLFRLPGCSSLVVVMGFTSGFPMGAILTRRLYEDNMLTADETERLACFTNNCSPLFIIGAVGVGMFNLPWMGYLLAGAHYLSNLIIGFFLGFRSRVPQVVQHSPQHRWAKACQELFNYQGEPPAPGKLLGDAVKTATSNVMAVGGFIILFAVLARMLTVWGIMDILAATLAGLLSFIDLSYPIAYGISTGLFEITIGSRIIAAALGDLPAKILSVSAVLAFSGFSIIAQVMSILAHTPVRLSFYLTARFMQIILSLGLTMAGYLAFAGHPAINSLSLPFYKVAYSFDAWTISIYAMALGTALILLLLLISLLVGKD